MSPSPKNASNLLAKLSPGWASKIGSEFSQAYMKDLLEFLKEEKENNQITYPPQNKIFRALELVDFDEVNVVILGQDPYHGPDQAVGLAFAVANELKKKPPSLKNIFKELSSDIKVPIPQKSSLTGWACQGVLLLNTVLTVRAGEAFSHRKKGWETFTDEIISALNESQRPLVFILWGAAAIKKREMITSKRHCILTAPHPSPLSAHHGFFGCKHFSKTNEFLKKTDRKIDWSHVCNEK